MQVLQTWLSISSLLGILLQRQVIWRLFGVLLKRGDLAKRLLGVPFQRGDLAKKLLGVGVIWPKDSLVLG